MVHKDETDEEILLALLTSVGNPAHSGCKIISVTDAPSQYRATISVGECTFTSVKAHDLESAARKDAFRLAILYFCNAYTVPMKDGLPDYEQGKEMGDNPIESLQYLSIDDGDSTMIPWPVQLLCIRHRLPAPKIIIRREGKALHWVVSLTVCPSHDHQSTPQTSKQGAITKATEMVLACSTVVSLEKGPLAPPQQGSRVWVALLNELCQKYRLGTPEYIISSSRQQRFHGQVHIRNKPFACPTTFSSKKQVKEAVAKLAMLELHRPSA